MTHVCDFVTNKYSAFSFGKATNNISKSMNHVLKPAARHKELPLDALVLALREIQGVHMYDFSRAVRGFGDYQLKEKFFLTFGSSFRFAHSPDFEIGYHCTGDCKRRSIMPNSRKTRKLQNDAMSIGKVVCSTRIHWILLNHWIVFCSLPRLQKSS